MEIDYTNIFNLIIQMSIVVFPIAIVFCVSEKLVDILLNFITGKRVKI